MLSKQSESVSVDNNPKGWIMRQTWHNLLFAHWPVDYAKLRRLVPACLELETYEGQAWLAVVPFHMSGIALRGLPAMPVASRFAELNVRTYVTVNGQPGVYFFSLDAASPVAVAAARSWYHLPYFNAKMTVEVEGDKVNYYSKRTHRNYPSGELDVSYQPTGPVYKSQSGTLENWLTERYCLYSVDRRGRVYRGNIQHQPWSLQPAQAEFRVNSVAQSHSIELPTSEPLLHYTRRLDMVAWNIRRVL